MTRIVTDRVVAVAITSIRCKFRKKQTTGMTYPDEK